MLFLPISQTAEEAEKAPVWRARAMWGRECISHHPDCLFTILGLRGAAGGCGDRQIWLKYFTPDWEPIWSLLLTGTANVHQLPTSSLALCKAFYHFRWILTLNSSMRWAFFLPTLLWENWGSKRKVTELGNQGLHPHSSIPMALNFSMHRIAWKACKNKQGPTPRSRVGPRIYIPKKFPGAVLVPAQEPHFVNHCPRLCCPH